VTEVTVIRDRSAVSAGAASRVLGVAIAAEVLFPVLAAAESPQSGSQPGTWQFSASIYAYLPTIDGTTSFPGGASDISIGPSQLLSHLKFTLMGAFDVHNGPWGAFTDVVYANLSGSKSQTRDFTIGNSAIPGTASANFQLDVKSWIWTLAGEYRVLDHPEFKLDLLAGTRYLSLNQKLNWTFSGDLGPMPPVERSGSAEAGGPLWDGIFGVRGKALFGAERQWSVPFYLDGGAGGSNQTFQVAGGIAYSFQWGDVTAMWRYLDYDLSGSKVKSITFDGPQIGATFRW
jgi:hypothetical protein